MMLQKDKDRLGYAEGMSEEEAKKLQDGHIYADI